jgi:hypothetical protein
VAAAATRGVTTCHPQRSEQLTAVISGLAGELGELESPLDDLGMLLSNRDSDVVDENIAEAVARAIATGASWGTIAAVLRQ